MGAKVRLVNPSTVDIDCSDVSLSNKIFTLTRQIRASYYLIGSMLGRFGKARTTMPGGCNFGVRPIDQHIKGFEALGATVDLEDGQVKARADDLIGNHIYCLINQR